MIQYSEYQDRKEMEMLSLYGETVRIEMINHKMMSSSSHLFLTGC
jgi:hypothetical protein